MHSVLIPSHPPTISFGLHSLEFSKSRRIAMNGGALCAKSCLSVGNEGPQTKRNAVIIVDHGSRRQESNLMLNEFVSMFKARTSYEIVEPAHMINQMVAAIREATAGELPLLFLLPLLKSFELFKHRLSMEVLMVIS